MCYVIRDLNVEENSIRYTFNTTQAIRASGIAMKVIILYNYKIRRFAVTFLDD